MDSFLFDEFDTTSPAAWKQKIQVDLKGADYNDALLWKTEENIVVKPFYTAEDRKNNPIDLPEKGFNSCQSIFIDDENIANSLANDALQRGANALQFTANKPFDYKTLLRDIDCSDTFLYFTFQFLSDDFVIELSHFINSEKSYYHVDIIGNLAETGNWFFNLKEDHRQVENMIQKVPNAVGVDASLYQNAGATCVQQLAYALAHANEYLNRFDGHSDTIHVTFSVGSNYFFEIAKLRAFRLLWKTLLKEYHPEQKENIHLFVKPGLRNKTVYDYNVNMLRTTSECMSAILGGANTISNVSYDALYQKSNEFGERISRNQLLILQQESGLQEAQSYADGAYYIESLTYQLAQKSLAIFKQIEKGGGFLKQLKEGIIQRKIDESAKEEQERFDSGTLVLLGTNMQQNKKDRMQQNIQLYPFLKKKHAKTLITPILKKRLSESMEQKRLKSEQ